MTRDDILRDADEAARRFAMQVAQEHAKPRPKPPEIETSEVTLKQLPITFGLKRTQ